MVSESFNLVSQPWVQVFESGKQVEVSLLDIAERGQDFSRLLGESPTQEVAILRVILAAAQRAMDPITVDTWGASWVQGRFPAAFAEYLRRWEHRFDLFDPSAPFFQVPGAASGSKSPRDPGKIVATSVAPLFQLQPQHAPLSYAEAARWLIHEQAYSTQTIRTAIADDDRAKLGKSYPIGPAMAGRGGIYHLRGSNLFETIMLNLVSGGEGLPVWEREVPAPGATDRPLSMLDLYTWSSRQILLTPHNGVVDEVLVSNGDPAGLQDAYTLDPMMAFARSSAQEAKLKRTPVYMPIKLLRAEEGFARPLWRSIPAAFSSGDPARRDQHIGTGILTAHLERIGLLASISDSNVWLEATGTDYEASSSRMVDTARWSIRLPRQGEEIADLVAAAQTAGEVRKLLRAFIQNLRVASGGVSEKFIDYDLVHQYDMDIHRAYKDLAIGLDDGTSTLKGWHRTVQQIVRPIIEDIMSGRTEVPVSQAFKGRYVTTTRSQGVPELINAGRAESWLNRGLRNSLTLLSTE